MTLFNKFITALFALLITGCATGQVDGFLSSQKVTGSPRGNFSNVGASFNSATPDAVTILPSGFRYNRYDAAILELPDEYPAKQYDSERLLNRLAMIAGGPELSKEDLELEFGLRFFKIFDTGDYEGVARGRYPLGNDLSIYVDSSFSQPNDRAIFITLKFRDQSDGNKNLNQRKSRSKICIPGNQLFKGFEGTWTLVSSFHPYRSYFSKIIANRRRMVETIPAYAPNRSDCIESFRLIYENYKPPN